MGRLVKPTAFTHEKKRNPSFSLPTGLVALLEHRVYACDYHPGATLENPICLYDDLSTDITEFHADVSPRMALMYRKLNLLSNVGGLSLVYTACARTWTSR